MQLLFATFPRTGFLASKPIYITDDYYTTAELVAEREIQHSNMFGNTFLENKTRFIGCYMRMQHAKTLVVPVARCGHVNAIATNVYNVL